MINNMGKKIALAILAAAIISGFFLFGCTQPIACTEEAKICPDGSSVVRNPSLNCEFNPCPEANCKTEGETIPVIANPPSCCAGLALIQPKQEDLLGISGICTAKCGNGTCDAETESAYNCPQDCITTIVADDSGATPEGVAAVVNGNNKFAFEFYPEFEAEENVFFSPYSISTALAMTYEGAKAETAEEMQSVFHFPSEADTRRPSFARIYNLINKPGKKYKLSTANALWAEQTYQFLEEYKNTVEKYYAGKTTNLDFKGAAEASRKIINAWVELQTNNKIKDLIPKGTINSMTRLVLTNAVYFKGTWLKQFDPENTSEVDFKVSPESTVKVQMMRIEDENNDFGYFEDEKLQALELPYSGKELSMIILLPKEQSLETIKEYLNAEKFSELRGKLAEKSMIADIVLLPKFKFETKYFMAETLAKMGMPTAFSFNADFSGMDVTKSLFIGEVIHQAFVEVNEEGTEAAAATAVIMEITSTGNEKIFMADHPFIFIIQEKQSGNILFFGKAGNPAA